MANEPEENGFNLGSLGNLGNIVNEASEAMGLIKDIEAVKDGQEQPLDLLGKVTNLFQHNAAEGQAQPEQKADESTDSNQ